MSAKADIDVLITKDANQIFQEYSVSEVETISLGIEEKANKIHADLQNLVSLKYRDLLKTSDLIIDMNEISKVQDKELYDLSFLKNGKLNKLFNIERNFNKFEKIENTNVDLYLNQNSIIKKNEQFIKLSNFLNIDESIIDNLEIIDLINKNLKFPINIYQNENNLIIKKFNNLINLTISNISNNFKIWEVLKIYKFWKNLNLFEYDSYKISIKLIEDEIFKNLIDLINYEFKDEFYFNYDNLEIILKEFPNFKNNILKFYIDKINDINLMLINTEDDKNNEKLNLYDLNFDDSNYLNNIKNLNNGLNYIKYQDLNFNLLEFIKVLNILKKLDLNIYNSNKLKILNHVNDFKSISIDEKNKLLTKYLDKLIGQINK